MRTDEVVSYGVIDPQGSMLWSQLRDRNLSHNDILSEMRREQMLLTAYSKSKNRVDDNARLMVRRIRLLEIFAWRIYMFGSEPTALYPRRMGELRKRQRLDLRYHRLLGRCNFECGTVGCEQLENLYRKAKRPCARPGCSHQGQKKADKWLKMEMRQEWERGLLRKYSY